MIEINGKSVELKDVSAVELESETRDGTWAIVDTYDGEHIAKDSYSRTENDGKKCRRYLLARTGADDAWKKVAKERDEYASRYSSATNKAAGLERELRETKDRVYSLENTLRVYSLENTLREREVESIEGMP